MFPLIESGPALSPNCTDIVYAGSGFVGASINTQESVSVGVPAVNKLYNIKYSLSQRIYRYLKLGENHGAFFSK